MRRADLTGQQFGELTALKYAGDRRWLCKCSCGKELTVATHLLTHNGKKSCGHKTLEQEIESLTYNIKGQHFGEWEVLDYLGKQHWLCKCSCGVERPVQSQHLRYGLTRSCGHDTTAFKDLTGQQFDKWKVIKYSGDGFWECECECGEVRDVRGPDLRLGRSTSCGCDSNKFKDETGNTFGEWTVLEHLGHGWYWCRCSCGTEQSIKGTSLRAGNTKHCSYCNHSYEDIAGQKFWEWTAEKYLGLSRWLCRCSCGNTTVMSLNRLKSGDSKSCGCKKTDYYEETMLETYGTYNASQLHMSPDQVAIGSDKQLLENLIDMLGGKTTPTKLSEHMGITVCQVMRVVRKHRLEDKVALNAGTSAYEDEIDQLFPCEYRNDRTVLRGKEIDFYYPEQHLGIEFNGTYWHSTKKRAKNYHQEKSFKAMEYGIDLIHIFEFEWNNPDIRRKLIDLISYRLGYTTATVKAAARDCGVRQIENTQANEFIERYHLQGKAPAKVNFGCFYKNELIGVMTFGTPRFNNNYEWELVRLVWNPKYRVTGGSAKLLSHFISEFNPSNIISYCDLSKFNGRTYTGMGFELVEVTSPNYKWVDYNNQTLSRYQTMKHKLIAAGLGTEDQTENDIMDSLGFLKVYDCGNAVFSWKA